MSPEQARGKSVDRRADIWAFGVVLFEMLTARRLFEGETVSDTLAGVLRAPIEFEGLPSHTPPAMRVLITRCLERDPRSRLRDIGEARIILEAVCAGDASASSLLGAMSRPESDSFAASGSRPRLREWVAWALVLVLIGAAAAVIPRLLHAPAPEVRAVRRMSIPLAGEVDLRYSRGGLSISPDGSRIAYVNGRKLFLREMSSWDAVEVPESKGSGTPFWSPDSEWVAYAVDRELWKARKDGSQRSLICTAAVPFGSVSGGAWLSDGRVVFRGKKDLMVVSSNGGIPASFVSANAESVVDFHEPIAALAGKQLLTVVHTQDGPNTVASVTLDGNMKSLFTIDDADLARPTYSPSGHVVVMRESEMWAAYALNHQGNLAAVQGNGQNEDLWLHDRRGSMIRATFTKIEHDMPSFSPDGGMLYFSTGTEDSYRIARKSTEGNEPEETIVPAGEMSPHYYGSCPILTEDGKRLFYTARGMEGTPDIAWLDLSDGAKPKLFITSSAREYAPRPNPHDASYLAYVSDESGTDQVYLTTWPDGVSKVPVSIEGGNWPRWKGDGSELYFARGNEIYAVSVSYDPLQLGRPQLLFSRPEFDDRQPFGWPAVFDVTQDGELFLTTDLVVEGELDPHIAIVENWASTLQR